MVSNISQIVYQLFQKDTLEEVSESELRYFVKQYPFSGTGHLLLAKKLQLSGEKRALERETAIAAIYFSNPAWLQYVLNGDAVAHPAVLRDESGVTTINDHEDEKHLPTQFNEDPITHPSLKTAPALFIEALTEKTPTEDTNAGKQSEPFEASSEINTSTYNEPENDFTNSHFHTAESNHISSSKLSVDRVESSAALTPDATIESATTLTPDALVESATTLTPDSNQEPSTTSTTDQTIESTIQPATETALQPATEPTISHDTDTIISPDTELTISAATEPKISPDTETTTADHQPVTVSEPAQPETVETISEIHTEPIISQPQENELEFQPITDTESETQNEPITDTENEPENQLITDTQNETQNEPKNHADLNAPNQPSETSEIRSGDQQPAASITNDAASTPDKNRTAEEPGALSKLEFDPYHTIDYFASQGIKLRLEDYSRDKLGQQLKSFTEWIRSMKRLPQLQDENLMNDSDQHSIRKIAEHSVEEKEVLTESMAEVWAKQGNYEKARQIYRKLSLQNPSKSTYFAAKIEQLKVL